MHEIKEPLLDVRFVVSWDLKKSSMSVMSENTVFGIGDKIPPISITLLY